MDEEPVITTILNIRNRALLIAGLAILAVIGSVAYLLNFSIKTQKSSQAETTKATSERDAASDHPRPSVSSRPIPRPSNEQERLAVLESRKAGCKAMIDASTRKLQQTLELVNDHEVALRNLETNDLGRQIASNEDLIEMFLALCESEHPSTCGD